MKDRSILLLAAAIIVASLIIAGAMMFSRGGMDMGWGGKRVMMIRQDMPHMPGSNNAAGGTMPKLTVEGACTKTGGTFANDLCTCSASTTLSGGMCMDAMGKPAGEMGQMMNNGAQY